MRVLVLGASGMLGNAVMRVFSEGKDWDVQGTLRSPIGRKFFPHDIATNLHHGIDVENHDQMLSVFGAVRPELVVNCIGQVKQIESATDPLQAIPINAMFPHRLVRLCDLVGARLVHMSTDCVFSGARGNYRECDLPDAQDLYGRTKLLGEVDYPNAITLRTSIIGHELQSPHGLVDWFLAQQGSCQGYTRAIFSGLPTVVLARIIRDVIAPRPELRGVYHVAASRIAKYDLLTLVAKQYNKAIQVVPDATLQINRSLDASRFHEATGYVAPEWPELLKTMYENR